MKKAIITIPHIQVTHASLHHGPFVWGFPSHLAWLGLMDAMNRQLEGISLTAVSVVNHRFEPNTSTNDKGYLDSLSGPRFSLKKNGKTDSFQPAQTGHANIELSVVFVTSYEGDIEDTIATVSSLLQRMRFAGGAIFRGWKPWAFPLTGDVEKDAGTFVKERKRWLVGSVMTLCPNLLMEHWDTLKTDESNVSKLDAWMDLFALHTGEDGKKYRKKEGWLVPITTGYQVVSPIYPAGQIKGARDSVTNFALSENIWDVAQWVSPVQIDDISKMFVQSSYNPQTRTYRCIPMSTT